MAFQQLQHARLPRRRNKDEGVHVYTVESRRIPGQVEVRIRLTRPLMERLQWSENERVNVLVGTDEDAGKVLVRADQGGIFQLRRSTPSGSSFVLSSRAIPLPAGINHKTPFKLVDGALEVTFGS